MLRNRTRGHHFRPLLGCNSGAYRYGERGIPGSKNIPQSHAGLPFRAASRRPFWSVSLRGARNSGIKQCSAIARGTTISAHFSETAPERIGSEYAKFRDLNMLRDRTRTNHFDSLVGDHSGAYRFRNREFPRSNNAAQSHAEGHSGPLLGHFSDAYYMGIAAGNANFRDRTMPLPKSLENS